MSTHPRLASICDVSTNVMEVTMSQLVQEVDQLCQLRPASDYNASIRHQTKIIKLNILSNHQKYFIALRHHLNSFELFFLVVGSLIVGVLVGVVGVACFKKQVLRSHKLVNL